MSNRPRLLSRATHLIPLVALLHTTPAFPQGTARSLDIQPGARQNGLGAAGVALLGDPSDALWWNPAALGFANRTSAQFTYAELLPPLANIPYRHVAAAAPLGSFGGFGTSFTRLDYGDDFGSELAPSIALGIQVHPMVAIGANLKWVQASFGSSFPTDGETFATDIGALVRFDRNPWRFGFGVMYQNAGGEIEYSPGDSYPLSRNWKLGASVAVPVELTDDLTFGGVAVLDFNQSEVTSEFRTWHGGVEGYVTYTDLRFAMRGGYYYDDLGEIQDLTFGAGLRAWMVSFDAAWIPQSRNADLDRVLKMTVGIHVDLSSGAPRWPMD